MDDNKWVENQIRPIAIGRNNWLFAGSLRAGKRAAAVMSLVHSARLNWHDPYAYLKDVLIDALHELLDTDWYPMFLCTTISQSAGAFAKREHSAVLIGN